MAIDHHHDFAPVFEQCYRELAVSRFSNAFTYGRYKVDVLLDRELGSLPRGSKVLDIGCGTGVYLNRFERMGLQAFGVEPAEAMRRASPSPAAHLQRIVNDAIRMKPGEQIHLWWHPHNLGAAPELTLGRVARLLDALETRLDHDVRFASMADMAAA